MSILRPNIVPFHMLSIASCRAIVTSSLRRAVFFPIFDFKNAVTLKTGLGDVKVIGNVNMRQSAYDFLLTLCITMDQQINIRRCITQSIATIKYISLLNTVHKVPCMYISIVTSTMSSVNCP